MKKILPWVSRLTPAVAALALLPNLYFCALLHLRVTLSGTKIISAKISLRWLRTAVREGGALHSFFGGGKGVPDALLDVLGPTLRALVAATVFLLLAGILSLVFKKRWPAFLASAVAFVSSLWVYRDIAKLRETVNTPGFNLLSLVNMGGQSTEPSASQSGGLLGGLFSNLTGSNLLSTLLNPVVEILKASTYEWVLLLLCAIVFLCLGFFTWRELKSSVRVIRFV
jgi:hypothetical protein